MCDLTVDYSENYFVSKYPLGVDQVAQSHPVADSEHSGVETARVLAVLGFQQKPAQHFQSLMPSQSSSSP